MLRDYSIKKCCLTSNSTGQYRESIMTNYRSQKNRAIPKQNLSRNLDSRKRFYFGGCHFGTGQAERAFRHGLYKQSSLKL